MMNPLPTPQESPVHEESMNRAVIHKPKDLDFAPWKQMRDSSLMPDCVKTPNRVLVSECG